MTQYVDTPNRSWDISTQINRGTRVVINSSDVLVAAGAAQNELGVLDRTYQTTGVGADGLAPVRLQSATGTTTFIANGAIGVGDRVYGAASGLVGTTPNSNYKGVALNATSNTGEYVEVARVPLDGDISTVEAKTADFDVEIEDSGKTFTSVGASGTVVATLPAAVVGLKYRFRVGAAQELRLDPDGTETIALPSTGVQGAAGKYLTANADGETVDIECTKAGQWSVFGYTGTWTAEA